MNTDPVRHSEADSVVEAFGLRKRSKDRAQRRAGRDVDQPGDALALLAGGRGCPGSGQEPIGDLLGRLAS